MKRYPLVIIIAAGLVAFAAAGQVTTQPAAPTPAQDQAAAAPDRGQAAAAQAQAARALAQAAGGQESGSSDDLGSVGVAVPGYYSGPELATPNSYAIWDGGREAEGSISVIDFKSPNQKTVDETGEDLKIMSILFAHNLRDKTVANAQVDYKLGIPLLLKNHGHSVEASYIEGVGALFSLRVRFPVVPPAVEETNATPAPKDSAWARAQRELAGEPDRNFQSGLFQSNPEGAVEFQSNLVETLKKQVIETLGEASNFRHLAPNETIMVTVTGAPNATAAVRGAAVYKVDNDPMSAQPMIGTTSANTFGSPVSVRWTSSHGQGHLGSNRATIMTIRIKQSDAQALAEHKMSREDFVRAAQVTTYLGPSAQPEASGLQTR